MKEEFKNYKLEEISVGQRVYINGLMGIVDIPIIIDMTTLDREDYTGVILLIGENEEERDKLVKEKGAENLLVVYNSIDFTDEDNGFCGEMGDY